MVLLFEENQVDGQVVYVGYQVVDCFVIFCVVFGGWQQFVQCQEYYYFGDQVEYLVEGGVVEDVGQGEIVNCGFYWFGQVGQQVGIEGVDFVLCGEVYWDGDCDVFGDVVDGDGEGQWYVY